MISLTEKMQKVKRWFRRIYPTILALYLSIVSFAPTVFAADATGGDEFFARAFTVLEILIILIGAGLALWGIVNLLEGYGNDNPGAKSQGIKQLMAGAGIILIGVILVPALENLFNANYTA